MATLTSHALATSSSSLSIVPSLAGQPGQSDHHMQPSPTPRSPTTANVRQAYPSVYSEPQPQSWYYYDPTRHWRPPSHFFTTPPVLAPHIPSVQSDTPSKSTTDSTLEHLGALQSQFTAFQHTLGNINSDVKDALSQLRTLRTAQNKTEKSIADLEGVIGVTSTPMSRSGRTKGRGNKSKAGPDAEVARAATVPEQSLVQSMASIQSAIQVLLARENQPSQSHLPTDRQQTVESSGLNHSEPRLSSHLVDPHRQSPTLQSTQFVSPPSQSGLSSPLSSLLTPMPEQSTSSFGPSPGKEYADASTQACPLSAAFEPSYSRKDTTLTPVDWSAVPMSLRLPVSNFVQQTAFTAEQSGPFSCDTPSVTNSVTDSQRDNDDPLHCSMVPHTQLPISAPFPSHHSRTPSSSEALAIPSASSSSLVTVTSSQTTISTSSPIQASSPTAEAVGLSHGVRPSDDSRMSSPLSSLTSTRNTPISVSRASASRDQLNGDLPLAVAQIPSQVHSNLNLPSGGLDIHASRPISVTSGFRRHSTPVGADAAEEVPSCLPTPPSETSIHDPSPREANRLTCTLVPALPASDSTSLGQDNHDMSHDTRGLARQERFGVFSQLPSPLTPPSFTPCIGSGSSSPEKNVGDASEWSCARKVMESRMDYHVMGTGISEGSTAERASEDVETLDSTMNSGVPAIPVTNEHPRSAPEFDDGSSPAPQAIGDDDLSLTPGLSVGHSDHEPPDDHPDVNATLVHSQMDGYDFTFSSPLRHPPSPAATPSRDATPSDSSNSRPTQEEDEVWDALMLSASGISTPIPDSPRLPLMFSHQPSHASSGPTHSPQQLAASTSALSQELLAVDPSMLHDPPPPHESGLLSSPQDWNKSLSSLTSLDDMDKEGAERPRPEFEASRSSSPSHSPTSAPAPRAASEVTKDDQRDGTRPLGGPSASLDQLVLLARREPLKIHLKLPERMRGLKRKWDGEGDEAQGEMSDAKSDPVRQPAGKVARQGPVKAAQTKTQVEVSPSRTGSVSSAQGTARQTRPVPECLVTRTADDVDASYAPTPPKRTKKRNERGAKGMHTTRTASSHTSIRRKESGRVSKSKQRYTSKYHVWNGQIVAVETESGPLPLPATEPTRTSKGSASSRPSVTAEEESESLTRLRHQSRRENQAMKAPLSSPPGRSSPRNFRAAKSSPTKEDLWDNLHQSSGTWPELPVAFSQWDVQFIQCDNCNKWYHYGCVGIQPRDPRLEPGSLFICPTCHTQSARRLTLRHQDDKCARSDCPEPRITSDTETFYLEKLVGRKKVEGYLYVWLAKWEGYPMSQATWIPKENVFGDGTRLFNTFLEEALEEGADLTQDLVLLREAVDAGWEE